MFPCNVENVSPYLMLNLYIKIYLTYFTKCLAESVVIWHFCTQLFKLSLAGGLNIDKKMGQKVCPSISSLQMAQSKGQLSSKVAGGPPFFPQNFLALKFGKKKISGSDSGKI